MIWTEAGSSAQFLGFGFAKSVRFFSQEWEGHTMSQIHPVHKQSLECNLFLGSRLILLYL